MKNPCKNCEERHQGCHAGCERYAAWKAEYDARKMEEWRARKSAQIPDAVHAESVERVRRRTNKR